MQIRSLTLQHFGKFNDKEIVLKPGLNILYGENEAGKSTIHTFIRAMLFGLEKKRGQGAKTDTYSKYEPWENPMLYAGTMEVRMSGRWYRLERNFQKDRKHFTVTDIETETVLEESAVQALYAQLEESSYMNTVSISQLGSETDSSLAAALREYAANLVNTRSTELNLQAAFNNLQNQKKEQKAQIKGLDAYSLEQQLLELEVQKKESETIGEQLQIETVEKDRERTAAVQELDKLQKIEREQNDSLAKMQAMLQLAQEKQTRLTAEAEAVRKEAESLTEKVQQYADRLAESGVVNELDLNAKRQKAEKKGIWLGLLILLLLAAAGCGAGLYFGVLQGGYALYSGIITGILLAAVIAWWGGRIRSTRLAQLDTIARLMKEKKEYNAQMEQAHEKLTKLTVELDAVQEEQKELTLFEIDTQLADKIREKNETIVALSMEIQNLQWKLEQQQNRQAELEKDRMQVQEKKDKLKAGEEEIAALDMAMENIRQITEDIRTDFGKQLNERASAYFSQITKGKYTKLSIDGDLNILVHIHGRQVPQDKLSKGTIEQIYLALRLAAAEALYTEKQPLLLDDTFAHYDNSRLANTLEALAASGGQLLVFTCHTREKVIADREGIPYHLVLL